MTSCTISRRSFTANFMANEVTGTRTIWNRDISNRILLWRPLGHLAEEFLIPLKSHNADYITTVRAISIICSINMNIRNQIKLPERLIHSSDDQHVEN